jgi:hypothetical protein
VLKFHPQEIVITENNPASVDSYHVIARAEDESPLNDVSYPSDPSGITTIPIGSNGFFDSVVNGTSVKLYVQQFLGTESASEQFVNRYIVQEMPDGADNIVVNY